MGYELRIKKEDVRPDTDIYALLYEQVVSVTPLSLDDCARQFSELDRLFRQE